MTVKDAIKKLSELDPDMKIMTMSASDGDVFCLKSIDCIEEVETDLKDKYVLIASGMDELMDDQDLN